MWRGGLTDAAPWAGSMGPWWTDYDPTGTVRSQPSRIDPTVPVARDVLHWLRSTTGEHAMADGEANMATDAGMAFWTSPIEVEHMYVIYRLSRTRCKANQGREHAGGSVSRWCHGRWGLEVAGTVF